MLVLTYVYMISVTLINTSKSPKNENQKADKKHKFPRNLVGMAGTVFLNLWDAVTRQEACYVLDNFH
jgi:hypothetical protein